MKRRLGISIYPDHSNIDSDKNYLKKAASYGFSKIFMSMLEVKENKNEVIRKYKEIIGFAKKLGYEVILDVSPTLFEKLDISYEDLSFFYKLGADGIRLDIGFDGNKESLLTFNPYGLMIELNMSNDVAYLDNILSYKANKAFLTGCHNFYPQSGTGLPYDFFVKCSQRFKKYGLQTSAFISSVQGSIGPWNINDGLPTLEIHRNQPVAIQAKHLFATNLIDDVIIGNAYASEEELYSLSEIDRYQLTFNVDLAPNISDIEKKVMFEEQHFRRGDIADTVIRSTEVRKKYASFDNPPRNNGEFQVGDIVIGNDLFGKYKFELQVVLIPHSDQRKNLVGKIKHDEQALLGYVEPWSKFRVKEG